MKMIYLLTLLILATSLMLVSCSGNTVTEAGVPSTDAPTEPDEATEADAPIETDAPVVTQSSTSAPEPNAMKTKVDNTTDAPSSLKILAVGNSFSVDAMEYLYQMLKSAGVEEIVLGNLYYGGCSLSQHCTFSSGNSASYKYYKNTKGTWDVTESATSAKALADENWDYITMQQASGQSGVSSSYDNNLTKLTDIVSRACPNAKLVWHQTWAYQQDSTHSSFTNYSKDQNKMYSMIVSCVKSCVESEDRITYLIPCGTSVQNLRTSYLGDTLTRDGYHMDYQIGRYVTGLTWACVFTGVDANEIKYNPSPARINDDMLRAAAEAVNNALANPYAVTESSVKTGKQPGAMTLDPSVVLDPADFFIADSNLASGYGIDLSKYKLLEWSYAKNSFYNSTSSSNMSTPTSGSTYKKFVCPTKKFSLNELPEGSVFICDDGWQYRLEKFPSENAKYTGTRPTTKSTPLYVLDSAFIGDCTYFTWNVSANPSTDISAIYAQAACHVRIYVPVQ